MKTILAALLFISGSHAQAHNSCASMLSSSQKLLFTGVDGYDVYNPTKPFSISFNGKTQIVLSARVEARDSEKSQTVFFTEQSGTWAPLVGAPVFSMQDPFFTFINGELIFGGVATFTKLKGGGYRTLFFRGRTLETLAPFARGPDGMKDIRLVEIGPKRIGLFTRPQGMIPGTNIDAGPGKIGFKIIKSLGELTENNITNTPLIDGQFNNGDWGGANEAMVLPNGTVGVLAHLARFDAQKNRHYYAAVFTLDPITRKTSPLEVILERGNLSGGLLGESKRSDLVDVVFSGGMVLNGGSATVYLGAGDAEVHKMVIQTPVSFR